MHASTPAAAAESNVLLVKRNFIRKSRGKSHQGGFTHHFIQRAQIKPARKLECHRKEHINPRLDAPRNKTAEHRHHKRSAKYRCSHSQYLTLHSTLNPARRSFSLLSSFPFRLMRTGTRCSTFTKFPVALSCGMSEKAAPVASDMDSTTPA